MFDFFKSLTAEQWLLIGFAVFIIIFLFIDLGIFQKHAHKVSTQKALLQVLFWVFMAASFAFLIGIYKGREMGYQFVAAYLTEESLSVDNMFLFILIFSYFRISEHLHHKVLFYGVLGAIVFRGIFITAGSFLIAEFHWILYVFGAILIFTGIKLFLNKDDIKFEPEKNIVYNFLRRNLRFTHTAPEDKFWIFKGKKIYFTTLFLVVCLIETTDIIFAVDSIPAVFSISQDPFVVYTSNIFAVMGLRALYFLLSGVMKRFRYLQTGLACILILIGVKMLLEIAGIKIASQYSLLAIALILGITVAASLRKNKK
jgi:TerC family integral membrane protein